ncbi:MAG: transcription-repair coupling factor [Clostridia bacterium]|nr:transcription-repair coupling factor [Clostridia bacterium]
MFKSSTLIRLDREFLASMEVMRDSYLSPQPLPMVVGGLSGGAVTAYLTEAVREAISAIRASGSGAPVLILVESEEARGRLYAELSSSGIRTLPYKMREPVLHNITASHDVDRERLSVLSAVISGEIDAVITTPDAALSYTMPRGRLEASSITLKVGDELSPDSLAQKLVAMGYKRLDAVEDRGQLAKRGGIVDFWGAETDAPIRVEFFGDEIDRIASFDPISQRSGDTLESFSASPSEEMVTDADARARMLATVDGLLKSRDIDEEVRAKLERERAEISSGVGMSFRDKYMADIYPDAECLCDYIASLGRTILFTMNTSAVSERLSDRLKKNLDAASGMASYGLCSLASAVWSKDYSYYEKLTNVNMTVHINTFAGGVGNIKLSGLFGFRTRRTVSYGDNPAMLFEDLLALRHGMYRTILLAESRAAAEALASSLSEEGIAVVPIFDDPDFSPMKHEGGRIFVTVGSGEGFELITPKIALLSMAKDRGRAIMQNKRRQRILRRVGGAGQRLMSHADLSVGDYVVHASYGIGRFEGIEAVTVDGVTKDYITIQYAGTDKLFVPCDRLENIGKYIGERNNDGTVKLSRMGGGEWLRAKSRAKAATEDIAKRLIQLYAERQRLAGYAFPPRNELEDEFDSRFEYEETESQLTAIEEIRRDMEKPVPMNRLLCGDVGFGKTEVALRAAFKAILAGKQVALLVPTTILALQHYGTALSRLRGYAVNVEMLSRFKKPKEREEILKRTERGVVDLLIGTHSLLSKNMRFRDLGLLIIDEEQRFGVVQKERLRELAKNVDTLMLSATPIPRTLNMAMSGISDISVLDEAPGERRPVQTYVLEHDDGIITDAIARELARGGQVLYIYNKIESIEPVAARIMDRLPEARVAVAHGRMEKEELEDIWQELVRGEIDVLVCTTIIETGVDLPNANTLIIENADRFGLSQLHQIRGRVGRSERQAYAYFTFRPGKALSEIAEKRLSALREFAEFGAGFKIALRDLEIRGAGNLLGAEQHGYIESVGYDLYLKLLSEAVITERGDKVPPRFEAQVSIELSAHIPERYISSSAARMEMYKKISDIRSPEDREDVLDEFLDRFGDLPKVVMRLVDVALTRALAEEAHIKRVDSKDGRLTFIPERPRLDLWAEVFPRFKGMSFLGVGSPNVVYRLRPGEDPARLAADILTAYKEAMNEEDKE